MRILKAWGVEDGAIDKAVISRRLIKIYRL